VQGYLLDIEGISKLMIDSPQSVQK
jgi:hypothetical protein